MSNKTLMNVRKLSRSTMDQLVCAHLEKNPGKTVIHLRTNYSTTEEMFIAIPDLIWLILEKILVEKITYWFPTLPGGLANAADINVEFIELLKSTKVR